MEFFAQLVRSHGTAMALGGMVIAGYVAVYLLLRRRLDRTIERLHGEWAEEFSSLMVAARLTRTDPAATPETTVPPVIAPPPMPAPDPAAARKEEVSPETLLVIAAAVTAFLGKKVRIRSARMIYSHESFNAWSQQGRAVIQASHNVAQRVH